MIPLTVIVIAQNEEANIRHCLSSVSGWACEVYVVDSFSTDNTVQLAQEEGALIVQHQFEDWAAQRNWTLDNLSLQTEWVLFLDADEQLPLDLKIEIEQVLARVRQDVAAFAIKQSFVFWGKYLKHAQDGPALVRLVRKSKARWFCEGAREYCTVDGQTLAIASQIWHEDHKGLSAWIDKHNRNASREARLLVEQTGSRSTPMTHSSERTIRTWLRQQVWKRLPLFVRPFLYFLYRYFLRGGIFDGIEGFVYTVLHAFWYNFLIDAKYYELQKNQRAQELIE